MAGLNTEPGSGGVGATAEGLTPHLAGLSLPFSLSHDVGRRRRQSPHHSSHLGVT